MSLYLYWRYIGDKKVVFKALEMAVADLEAAVSGLTLKIGHTSRHPGRKGLWLFAGLVNLHRVF